MILGPGGDRGSGGSSGALQPGPVALLEIHGSGKPSIAVGIFNGPIRQPPGKFRDTSRPIGNSRNAIHPDGNVRYFYLTN